MPLTAHYSTLSSSARPSLPAMPTLRLSLLQAG
jgi:hypothetical protein